MRAPHTHTMRYAAAAVALLVAFSGGRAALAAEGLQEADLSKLQSVGEVRVSRDGSRVVYAVVRNDRPGRPYSQLMVQDVGAASGKMLLPKSSGELACSKARASERYNTKGGIGLEG